MFNFFKRKSGVLNHWIAFADGFQTSPTDFYAALEKELEERRIPKMEMSRIEFAEGGLLSEKRIYLRMLRERLVFDVCAAPFGSGFFFSCRTAEIPIVLKWWHLLLFLLGGYIVFNLVTKLVYSLTDSVVLSLIGTALLFGLAVYSLRNAVALGLQDLDTSLIRIPVIGPLYEVLFRKETYHRIDSRLCYLEAIPSVVKKLAEDTTATKGIKLIRQYELAPVLGDLYRPSRPTAAVIDLPLPESPKL